MSKKVFVPKSTWREKAWRLIIWLLGWIGIAVLFYVGFSFFFDTPLEHRMKRSTASMRREYEALSARYDSLEIVLNNVVDRDRNVFRILFESEPYDLDADTVHWQTYEDLLERTDRELARELNDKIVILEGKMAEVDAAVGLMEGHTAAAESNVRYIPAIQPILNPGLTLLTASFGLRIQPFSKKLASHTGVDYTVPEGSRVFATADGRVKDVMRSNSSSGLSIVIDHGGEYETQYSHLARANVARGETVERGDIIGLTGNTGLSLSPHLHYEVRHDGMPVDPIHYFFMELGPSDYRRIRRIARSGMQSFD